MNIAWAAGLFEGEGSISPTQYGKQALLQVTSTDKDVLERLQKVMRCGTIYVRPPSDRTRKTAYSWHLQNLEQIEEIFALWKPFLGKRRKARFKEIVAQVKRTRRELGWYGTAGKKLWPIPLTD